MITQGPFTLTLSQVLPLTDPGANSNHPATAVQLQNASPFIVQTNAGGIVHTIQSFTAQTVPYGQIGGQPLTVFPIETNTSDVTAPNSLTVVWLLAGESSPMVDGSLTAAAITAGLQGQGIAGVGLVSSANLSVAAAGGGATFPIASGSYRVWNYGFAFTYPATPTKGAVIFQFLNVANVFDAVSFTDFASNRLAGMLFQTGGGASVNVANETDVALLCFIDYSPA